MATRLVTLLRAELRTMEPQEKLQFRRELSKTLPGAVKLAADNARQPVEMAPVKGDVIPCQEN